MRVARPETAAASGTVVSTTVWPSRSTPLRFVSVSDWLRNGTVRTTTSALVAASAFSAPAKLPPGTAARARRAAPPGPAAARGADDDRDAGPGPAHGEAEPEGAGRADDGDRGRQG